MALSSSEAARMLGVTPRRVTELVRSGLLVAERNGRSWEIDEGPSSGASLGPIAADVQPDVGSKV